MAKITSLMQYANRLLKMAINWLGINKLGSQRPLLTLFLGAFLITGSLPLLTYLVFASVAMFVGVFLLVVIEGGILTMATLALMAALILPACIAGGLSVFIYTIYAALSQMKLLVESAVSAPQKPFTTDGFKSRDTQMTLDEKPNFVDGKFRFKRAKIISGDPDNDSDSEEDDVQGTNCHQAHLMGEADRVHA